MPSPDRIHLVNRTPPHVSLQNTVLVKLRFSADEGTSQSRGVLDVGVWPRDLRYKRRRRVERERAFVSRM